MEEYHNDVEKAERLKMIIRMYQKYQKTNLYRLQCQKRAEKKFVWLKKNYEKFFEAKDEVKELIQEMEEFCNGDYTGQINYSFVKEYDYVEKDVYYDVEKKMFYAKGQDTNNRRMYFAKSLDTKDKVIDCYKSLCIEQNEKSPHRYLSSDFVLSENDILLDIGAAEGNFSLNVVDKVAKIYLFECENEWMDALQATFEPYKEKVCIINKYVGSQDTEEQITLDTFLNHQEHKDCILKMDIEGAELKALEGATESIHNGIIKGLLVCTYHNQDDEQKIRQIFNGSDYEISASKGYIVKMADLFSKKPYIRRGLLRIKRIK